MSGTKFGGLTSKCYVHNEHNNKLNSNKQVWKYPSISLGSKHKIDYVYLM